MKALQITGFGKLAKNLSFTECELPVVQANDVLIEIHAAGINPIDYKTVKGLTRLFMKMRLPAFIGFDVSGVVKQVGSAVSNYQVGDDVFARVGGDRPGTLAEYIAVDTQFITRKPASISHEEAASIPLVGLTTLQAFKMAGLTKGKKVLIHAGSGGIGSFAVQYAKVLGAEVFTTTSTKNVNWVKALGADRVIDYKSENYLQLVDQVDMVYDTLGGKHTNEAFEVLKEGGAVINLSGPVLDKQAVIDLSLSKIFQIVFALTRMKVNRLQKQKKALYRFFLMKPNGEQLGEIARLMEEGRIKAVIDSVYPFDQSIQALQKLETGRAKGKIIVRIKA